MSAGNERPLRAKEENHAHWHRKEIDACRLQHRAGESVKSMIMIIPTIPDCRWCGTAR